jgi:hypothetical protein
MSGTQLFGLLGPDNIFILDGLADLIATKPYTTTGRDSAAGGGDDAGEHRCATDGCNTLGLAEYMRVPLPAARMTILRLSMRALC